MGGVVADGLGLVGFMPDVGLGVVGSIAELAPDREGGAKRTGAGVKPQGRRTRLDGSAGRTLVRLGKLLTEQGAHDVQLEFEFPAPDRGALMLQPLDQLGQLLVG